MNGLLILVGSIIQITILDIVLSGDNVSVIALAVRNLPKKQAKTASVIGIGGAVAMRILFCSIVTLILKMEWLPIKLIGGLLLIKITWDLINLEEEAEDSGLEGKKTLWKAVSSIIIADLSMSLDNVIAVAGAAKGNLWLIIFGLVISIPIIFLGSQIIAKLMNKYKIIVYIGAGLLIYTAMTMITEDRFIAKYIKHNLSIILSIAAAIVVVLLGYYRIKRELKNNPNDEEIA